VDYIRVQIVKCLHGIEEFKLELKSGFKIEFESTKQKRKREKKKRRRTLPGRAAHHSSQPLAQ
jgi:hypothetical protein